MARFCALQYRTQEKTGLSALERIIVLLIRFEIGGLRIFSRQDWPSLVQHKDLEYIRDLLADFKERARSSPEALFEQVSSLSVGPLVTYAVGSRSDLNTSAGLLRACKGMADIS